MISTIDLIEPDERSDVLTKSVNAGDVLKIIQSNSSSFFAKYLDPIIAFTSDIPAYSGNILEWHFEKENNPFDFAYRINSDYDKTIFPQKLQQGDASSIINGGYQNLVQKGNTGFRFGIENLWVEYDFPVENQPAIFFDMYRDKRMAPKDIGNILVKIVSAFRLSLDPALPAFLEVIDRLQLKAVYFGFMFSRNSETIRFTINGIQPERLAETLLKLNWDGNIKSILDLQTRFLASTQEIVLAVDFNGYLMPKIGVEVFDLNTAGLLEKLLHHKMISGHQVAQLKSWVGKLSIPAELAAHLSGLHQRSIITLHRRLNHFKFTIDGEAVKAKTYLYYCF